MKHNRLFAALILCILFITQTYSQGCYYPASFSYNNIGGGTVSFTNTSQMISASSWNFGDGNTSTQNHPTHTYTSNGTYTVTLDLTYVWNMGVYGSFTCYSTVSGNIFINNAISTYGCMDTSACNYSPIATIDDGSCILSSTLVTLQMNDSYGDGWNGDTWSAISNTGGASYGPFTLNSGYSGSQSFCLADDCYDIICDFGSWQQETSWSLIDDNGNTLASGGSPYNSTLCTFPIVSGCTNPAACNYDSAANTDDGSCNTAYGCMDPIQFNYDVSATCDDGSCQPFTYGCTDNTASNYNSTVNTDDGSCTYPATGCTDYVTGLNTPAVLEDRVIMAWDNMNTSSCTVTKYNVRYRELGSTGAWSQKGAGWLGCSTPGGLQKVDRLQLNMNPSTTYEWKMKVWYCDGNSSYWGETEQFTTQGSCPDLDSLQVQTFPGNHTRALFTWDSTATYEYARVKLRVDTVGAAWQTAGGFGVYLPLMGTNKFGLVPGESYRGQAQAYCHPVMSAWASNWTPLIFWTQPGGDSKVEGGTAITNLDVYPNPSRDIFNISFTSEDVQDLRVRILNVVGELIIKEELEQFVGEYTKQIDLSNNAKGIYFLEITTDNAVVNKKLILQ